MYGGGSGEAALATTEQVIRLSNATKLQANSALWHAHRRGRITASIAHTVLKCRDPKTAMNQIMKHDATDISCVPAVKWGIDNEATARHEYSAYMCQIHDNLKVEEAGLVIDSSFPFIAGSPDGSSRCTCHGTSVIGIKCPFKYRSISPVDPSAIGDQQYCLDSFGNLKNTHKYYTQVQTQMMACKCAKCDFIVWTPQAMVICTVLRDATFCDMCTGSRNATRLTTSGLCDVTAIARINRKDAEQGAWPQPFMTSQWLSLETMRIPQTFKTEIHCETPFRG